MNDIFEELNKKFNWEIEVKKFEWKFKKWTIYFVRFMDKVKIWRTQNLKNRLYQLKLSNPDIELLWSFEYNDIVWEEDRLHCYYSNKRIRNTEWFYLTNEEVEKEIKSIKF